MLGTCDSLKHNISPVQNSLQSGLGVTFDDDRAVAGAGLELVATLSKQLGTYTLANELIDLGAVRGHATRRKMLTFVDTLRIS